MEHELRSVEIEINRLQEKKVKLLNRKEDLKNKQSDEATKKLASFDWETNGIKKLPQF